MSDFYDLELNIRKLCSDAVLRSEKHKNMLCTYYDMLTEEENRYFSDFSDRFWQLAKNGAKKYKITQNAIVVALRIKRELDISCYPMIEKIATKGWSTSDGTFSWSIRVLTDRINNELYSFEPVSMLLSKKYVLSVGEYNTFTVISAD